MISKRSVRLSVIVGLTLAVAAWIAFAQMRLFPSMLNKCAVAHPWLLHNGFVDYRDIPGQKSPLLPLFLSWLLPLFGHDAALAARTAHVLFIALIVLFGMLWVYRHAGAWAWGATGTFFVTWSNFFGLWATSYYDVALAPLYLLFFVLLAGQLDRPTPWALAGIGLVNGLAILTKQHAVLLALPVAVLLAWHLTRRTPLRRLLGLGTAYAAALLLPLILYAAYYYQQTGSFADLVYWTVTVNLAGPYASEAASAPGLDHVRDMVPALVLLLPFAGSLLLPTAGMRPRRGERALLLAMFLLGALLIYPRYTPRHWPAAFPFLAMLSGCTIGDLVRSWRASRTNSLLWVGAAVVTLWLAIAAIVYVPVIRDPKPDQWSEYSDLVPLAAELRERLPAGGSVVLVPLDEGNANLSYLLGRLPAPYWLFNYSWWVNPTVIGRWLEVMEESKPPTVLYFPEGIDLASSAPEILDYVNRNYALVDTVGWGNSRQVQIMLRRPAPAPALAKLVQALEAQTRPGDALLVTPSAMAEPLADGYGGPAGVHALPATDEELAGIAAGHERIFLVIGDPAAGEVDANAQSWLNAHTFRAGHRWVDGLQVVVYGPGEPAAAPSVQVGALLEALGAGGGPIELLGYHLPPGPWQPGDVLPLTLFWQADEPPAEDYQVFVHLLDASGELAAQNDAPPTAGLRPTGGWAPRELVADPHGLWLRGDSQDLPPGEYALHVGMYLPASGERLAIAGGPGAAGDSLFLTTVKVVAP